MIPGELFAADGEIELNVGRRTVTVKVDNTGDRPIQVGSHYHFYETNPALSFDRAAAYGFRLDIASGTAVRFEPGQGRTVTLVALAGRRAVHGLRGAVAGPLKASAPRVLPAAIAPAPVPVAKPSKAVRPAARKAPTNAAAKKRSRPAGRSTD